MNEAGGQAGGRGLAAGPLLDLIEKLGDQGAQRREGAGDPALGGAEDQVLAVVGDLLDVGSGVTGRARRCRWRP